jgi:hypothetical protein
MTTDQVSAALAEMIEERAARGNAQSKHGTEAAEGYELHLLAMVLGQAMDIADGCNVA